MNSQRRFNQLLLVLGVVLLLGVSVLGPRRLSDQRLARLKPARNGQVATQPGHQPSISEGRERSAGRQVGTPSAPLSDEQQAQGQSTSLPHSSASQPAGMKITDTVAERIEPAPVLPAAKLEARESAGLKETEPRPDQPDEAARFRRLQMQDEKGFIPFDGLEKARQHVALMKAAQQERRKARQGAPKSPQEIEAAGIEPDSWTPLGPGNIGGRIRSIVIHPTNTNTMWVGSVSGGIWRTDNGGGSWFPVNDFLANLTISTMVINPANPNIMYAGTGEIFAGSFNNPGDGFTPDGLLGAGVFNSTDGGLSWNQLPGTNPANPGNPPGIPPVCPSPATPANCPWLYVNRLAISPNGNTILAATGSGIRRSTDAGATWDPTNVPGTGLDIDFHPADNQRAIASGNRAALYSNNGGQNWTLARFSTDGGTTFVPISGRVEVAYAPSNPAIVYASVNQNQGDIYRSIDGGQNYTRRNTGTNFLDGQGEYDNIIWVNPQDPNFVIVGGVKLWRSTDFGNTLSQITGDTGASAHDDHHMIVAHPGFNNTTNRIAFFGNDGGIYKADNVATANQGIGWENLNHDLGITQFYGAAGNATTGVIVGGTQDNGTVRFGGTEAWGTMEFGDGGFCAADPTSNYFYGEYTYLRIYRSTNGEAPAPYIYNGITDANNGASFVAPFILDPNNANTMLAGGLSLWRSTNVTATTPIWTAIKTPATDSMGNNIPISAIAVSPINSAFICVANNNGFIYLTFNGTANPPVFWTKLDTAALPKRFVTRLVIDSTRSSPWIYATFGGFKADNVYRTTDLGTTWTDVTGAGATGLPDVPVRSLVIHPRNSNFLYVGTEVGVFSSEDTGATWALPQDGPANVSVDELFWMAGDLIAATHGRGLYRASGGIYVDCNYNGTQLGTFDQPFKTVTAAVNAAPTYRTIWIKPCNYNETFPMLNKRVELRSLGGTVNIGKP